MMEVNFKDTCIALHRIPAKMSAQMAIDAAHFCAKVGRLKDAKEIYREVIVNYTGLILQTICKASRIRIRRFKRIRTRKKKKASKGK